MRRRTLIKTTAGLGTVLIAGCTGSDGGTDPGGTGTGTFRLLISDQSVAIDDFESLDVTLSGARVFRTDDDEELTSAVVKETVNETEEDEDPEGDGFVEFDLDSVTVDLTQVKGDRAVSRCSRVNSKKDDTRASNCVLPVPRVS